MRSITEGTVSVCVMDNMGRTILKQIFHVIPGTSEILLNTSSFAPGAYFLKVLSPQGEETLKLVKLNR